MITKTHKEIMLEMAVSNQILIFLDELEQDDIVNGENGKGYIDIPRTDLQGMTQALAINIIKAVKEQ